jgi:hypothetical protein
MRTDRILRTRITRDVEPHKRANVMSCIVSTNVLTCCIEEAKYGKGEDTSAA